MRLLRDPGPAPPAGTRGALGEGARPEGRLDPCLHGVEIDPNRGQRLTVSGAEKAGRLPAPDEADDLGFHASGVTPCSRTAALAGASADATASRRCSQPM
jgi:hypothetical protein